MAELKAWEPTPRDQSADWLQKLFMAAGWSPYKARLHARAITGGADGVGLADATPAGLLFGMDEGARQALEGVDKLRSGSVGGGLLDVGFGALQAAPGGAAVAALRKPIARGLLQMGENAAAPRTLHPQRGVFMGDLSETWNKEAADKALEMDRAGIDPRTIWKETGTFKGADGKWRQEIDDSGMKGVVPLRQWSDRRDGQFMAPNVSAAWDAAASQLTPQAPVRAKRLFEHVELDRAYPSGFTASPDYQHRSITSLPVQLFPEGGSVGAYDGGAVFLNSALTPGEAKSTLLHELQHAIQHREGFASGGSIMNAPPGVYGTASAAELEAQYKALGKALSDIGDSANPEFKALMKQREDVATRLDLLARTEAYRRLAGEAEARAVQSRMNLNAQQRRDLFPFDSYDVPVESLIVRR